MSAATFDKLLRDAFKPQQRGPLMGTGYVVVIIMSDGNEKRIPYIESQRPQAEGFIAMLRKHGITAWLARP